MEQVAVVGDVHGDAFALNRALPWIKKWDRDLIFVGDFVNRGPDTRGVLDALLEVQAELRERATFLLGNHEVVLLDFLGGQDEDRLLAHGGLITLNSYIGSNPTDQPFDQIRDLFPREHRKFLQQLASHYETEDMIVSHCGIDPARQSSRELSDLVMGRHTALFNPEVTLEKTVVSGHYVQRTRTPFFSSKYVCVDTGCGTIPGAPLSIVTFPDRKTYQF